MRSVDKIDCPLYPTERLSAFADGELTGAEAERVRAHLTGCARCRDTLEELSAMVSAARTLERPEPPAALWRALEGVLERPVELAEPRAAPLPWWLRWRVFGAGALAGAAVALLLVVGLPVRRGHKAGGGDARDVATAAAQPGQRGNDLANAQLTDDPLLNEAEAEFAQAAAAYERSIEKLRGLLAREEPRWSADERARYAERLVGLDEAIARSRELARRTPGDSVGNEQLLAAYQQKIAFLSAAVHWGGALTGAPDRDGRNMLGEAIER
jgi:hypothetical protein